MEANSERIETLLNCFENTLHDIKTPVSIIYMLVQNMESSKELPDSFHQPVTMVMKYCLKIIKLLYEMNDYDKLLQGRFVPALYNCDVVAVLESVTRAAEAIAEKKNIAVGFESTVPRKRLAADRDMLERIFLNILSNAIKFTPDGGEIKVTLQDTGENIVVIIADSGSGFAEDELKNVFQRYETSSAGFDKSSGGLGLSIVREMVTAHGGNVSAHNGENGGAVITIELPVRGMDDGLQDEPFGTEFIFNDMIQTALYDGIQIKH